MAKGLVIVSLLLISLGLLALFGSRQNKPEMIGGAITIKRIHCEASRAGIYTVRLIGQNTTDANIRDLKAQLTVGKGEALARSTVSLGAKERGAFIELAGEVPFEQKVDVCFAKFFAADSQPLNAVFRP